MIFLKTEEEIELLRESNLLVCKTLAELAKVIQPGITTAQLDKLAEEFIRTILPGDMNYKLFKSEADQIIKVWEGFGALRQIISKNTRRN